MLAFELPPSDMIAIEYVGLARQSSVSELQKDLLRQVLGEIIPGGREFVDAAEAPSSAQSNGVFLRCLQCDLRSDKQAISATLLGEEKINTTQKKNTIPFKILITLSDKSTQTWVVEIGPRQFAWYASIKPESLNSQSRLQKSSFQIHSCLDGIDCPAVTTFATKQDCIQWTERFLGKRVDLLASQSLLKKDKLILVEKTQFLSDVRAQSVVRTLMSSNKSSLTIKTQAKALKAGTMGEYIPVEISAPSFGFNKTRQIEARITGEGEVEIVR